MATRRKIRDAQDARRCLAAAEASGLSRREWARQHGVDGRSLFAWTKKLPPEAPRRGDKPSGMVELIPDAGQTEGRYVIRYGQLAVEVDEHFDEATLTRLLKVVAAC